MFETFSDFVNKSSLNEATDITPAKKIEDYGYANVGYMNRKHNGLDGIAFVQVGPGKKYMNHEASRGFRIPETAGYTHNPSKIYPPRFFVSCFDVSQTKGNILDLLKCAKKGGTAFEIEGAKWVGLFDGS